MALSNRDRIGQLFELLAPELDDYIQQTVAPVLTGDAAWTALVALHDAQKHGGEPRDYSRADPQVQLRMLTERITGRLRDGWYPFDDTLGRSGQNFASELREVRNRWAHNDSFTDDDAYRALDTTERLLGLIGSPQAAERVRQIRLGLRR
ncbi:MAG TPA: Swt1 family HEPN domain-containing protein, partial [Miltoncostaeaceae bacterium]|nr:Swt1 family HEPN domain-containing protein [Miltoncostaeaceae bacterium]